MFYFDSHNLLVQKSGDGGDCMAETGRYYTGLWIRKYILGLSNEGLPNSSPQDFMNAVELLEAAPGIWRRHPTQWSDPNDCSRDQDTPMMIALSLYAKTNHELPFREKLLLSYEAHKARHWKYQNADIASPEHINYKRRGLGIGSYWFGDLFMLGASYVRSANSDPDNVADDLNHTLAIVQAQILWPTIWSSKALSVYRNGRKPNYGTEKLGESNPIQGAWSWYFRDDSGNSFEMADVVWKPVIKNYFG